MKRVTRELAVDIQIAARSTTPILITAPPECARRIAQAIADRGSSPDATRVLEWDPRKTGGLPTAPGGGPSQSAEGHGQAILLLCEVHELSKADQAALQTLLAGPARIIASSSVSLFDRVRQGAFDARLFYALNVIHINALRDWPADVRLEQTCDDAGL